mmetsp:Transcript_47301/g.79177  ORF Transcript_47301/g.79177 Transcript_47301/m.79177 type:complete len:80 (+) Transcript_47301:273-512(+)
MLFMLLLGMVAIASDSKERKKTGDGHYRWKCIGKTSDGNNCEARRVVTGSNEAYRWRQLKPHTCTMEGVVQYAATSEPL